MFLYKLLSSASAVLTTASSIVVRISAEVTKPRDDRPFDGLFNINLELTAMGSPAWENGRYAPELSWSLCGMIADQFTLQVQ